MAGAVAQDRQRCQFSFLDEKPAVAELCVTIGRYVYLFKRLTAV